MSRKDLDHPYRVGLRKRPNMSPRDATSVKAIRKLIAYVERRRALEAIRIGQEAVKRLGFGEDDTL